MKIKFLNACLNKCLIAAVVLLSSLASALNIAAQARPVKNVVIVHGAFADGSGFKALYNILTKKGYNVTIVQNPLTSLKDDVDATNRILDKQDGPAILVGHSWAGMVITEAGVHPKVAALVYVAAFAPDSGETAFKLISALPPAPEAGILPPDDKGVLYYDKAKFHDGFAGDLSKAETDFMFASQGPIFAKCFGEPVTRAAWKTKPAYGVVATADRAILPEIERSMYKHASAKITEVKASHVVYISQPEAVAKVIIEAANNVK